MDANLRERSFPMHLSCILGKTSIEALGRDGVGTRNVLGCLQVTYNSTILRYYWMQRWDYHLCKIVDE